MGQQYIGEVRLLGFSFAPRGWAACNGQLLPINQNQALFSLLGTSYGGDGRVTFGLPNLQGRVALGSGPAFAQGVAGGEESHVLTAPEVASHVHLAAASSNTATVASPANAFWAASSAAAFASASNGSMAAASLASPGAGPLPHVNMAPYVVVNFVIALQGIYPSRN